jgi:hypothetical protein
MRFILGIVIGAVLVVGAAYVHDKNMPAPTAGAAAQPIVNWETLIGLFGR